MKYSELTRLMKSAGCRLEKHKTRHDWWVNEKTGEHMAIPRHQSAEVSPIVLKNAMKFAGLE